MVQQRQRDEQRAREAAKREMATAWERFYRFASKRDLNSGQLRMIEPIVKALGHWKRQAQWKDRWQSAWSANQTEWAHIIRRL